MEIRTYTLSDVLTLIMDFRGKTPKKLGLNWSPNGDIAAISAKNIKHGQLVNMDKCHRGSVELYKTWMKDGDLREGDLLLTSEAPLGEWYKVQAGDKFILSQRTFALRPDPKVVDADYFASVISSRRFQDVLHNFATGTTVTGIRQKTLLTVPIELPDIDTQKKIGQVISDLHAKFELNQKISKNLLSLANLHFSSTFPNVHEGESRLSDVMENFDRKRIPLARREREKRQGAYRYVGATSVLDCVDDYLFDGTYLLMGEDGTVQDENGFPILQYIWGKFWPNNHTHVLKGTIVSTEWLYLFLMNTNVKSRVTGAVQQKISQSNMNSIPLTIPSENELSLFQKQINPLFAQIKLFEEQNRNLTKLRALLLPKLISGDIDLSSIETVMKNA